MFVFGGQLTLVLAAGAAMCESGAHAAHGPCPLPAFALPGAHAPHALPLPENPGTQKQSNRPTENASDELEAGHATLLSLSKQNLPGSHGQHAWSLWTCCVLKKPSRHTQSVMLPEPASEREFVGHQYWFSRKQNVPCSHRWHCCASADRASRPSATTAQRGQRIGQRSFVLKYTAPSSFREHYLMIY